MKAIVAATAAWLICSVAADCGCTSDETCCQDDQGYACCLNDETMCVKKSNEYPARCCPRWTVGCNVGSVGCCDPAVPWQRVFEDEQVPKTKKETEAVKEESNSSSYFALFMGFGGGLEVTALSSTGHVISNTRVTGAVKTWTDSLYGESTRVFPFDSKNQMFHFLDGSDNTNPILYSISTNGESTAKNISLVTGYPLGQTFHEETGTMIFSILKKSNFIFYEINPTTGSISELGHVQRGTNETEASYYAGYITGVTQFGKSIYRIGYKKVSSQEDPGLGLVTLAGTSTASWNSVPVPSSCFFYYSVTRMYLSDNFISLAPSKSGDHSFQVVIWGPGKTPKVIGTAEDSHPPSYAGGNLGYIAAAQNGATFGAIVVHHHRTSHKWGLLTVDIPSSKLTYTEITPEIRSATRSLSGFGIAN